MTALNGHTSLAAAVLETALHAYKLGYCVLPVREDGSKRPDVKEWEPYQKRRPSSEHMKMWYREQHRSGLGLVCGLISGNLEAFEFDDAEVYDQFMKVAAETGLGDLCWRIAEGYEERTPGGGIHWLYRCPEIDKNTKLARRPVPGSSTLDVLIETRGEGGFVVISPSGGAVHPTGNPYELTNGDLGSVVEITPDERRLLFELARSFDEQVKTEYQPSAESEQKYSQNYSGEDRPGDRYDERGPSWRELLEPYGWSLVFTRGQTEYWRRPDKQEGVSATINGRGVGPDRLYVFTSSTVFEPERSYGKFQAYAVLEHGGDFAAAATALAKGGYGSGLGTIRLTRSGKPVEDSTLPVSLDDFRAYMPEHKYIFVPSRELWPGSSVNARLGPVEYLPNKFMKPSEWLDQKQPVEQMTWAPGEPQLIAGRLISEGGWIERDGLTCFNLYRPPVLRHGDASLAGPWVEHVKRVYPGEAEHIMRWLAHRVQFPQVKINHALVLGGHQGVGKDTLLEPVKYAVGPWNFQEVSPAHLLGRFNGFVKSVVLRVSEARDLGDVNRFAFYDHMKIYTAAPPDVLRCDEKNVREYAVLNVCGVIITSNHKTDGIYLPADDRRHFVAWSNLSIDDFQQSYWTELYRWYESGGYGHIGAYLAGLDLNDFNPKAPPPKTEAFWDIVDSNRAPEDADLSDALDYLGYPPAVTLKQIGDQAQQSFAEWIKDRKNSRQIPHRMEDAGYTPVRNPDAKDGLWKVGSRRQVVYAKRDLPVRDRITAVKAIANDR